MTRRYGPNTKCVECGGSDIQQEFLGYIHINSPHVEEEVEFEFGKRFYCGDCADFTGVMENKEDD